MKVVCCFLNPAYGLFVSGFSHMLIKLLFIKIIITLIGLLSKAGKMQLYYYTP